jgi:Abnormal spindle-like microcephaly-assoc'd, ASPM-SPD-2-Hydin/IPT/TIG domain
MKAGIGKRWILSAIFLGITPLVFGNTTFSVNPKPPDEQLDFKVHDIGTTTPQTVAVRNESDKAIDLQVVILNTSEYFWSSRCLKDLRPKQTCEVTVTFTPRMATPSGQQTKAEMQISANGESEKLALTGVGFPNFNVSPERLSFGDQLVNGSSSPQVLTATNNTGKALSNLQVTPTGDFKETHSDCQAVNAGASCAISVVFSPKHEGPTTGALTVSVSPSDAIVSSRVAGLSGNGALQCNPIRLSYTLGTAIVVIVCGIYFLGLVLVRWHMIAKPARLQLRAQILAIRARLESDTTGFSPRDELTTRKKEIGALLDCALYGIKAKNDPCESSVRGAGEREQAPPPRITRVANALFWTRGHELAGWGLAHEAEEQLVALLPLERVRARMETAEQQLRQINTAPAISMADRLRDALHSGDAILQERLRSLLAQASIFDQTDVPAAAQQTLLANSMQKTADFLNDLVSWVQISTAAAINLAACQTTLTQFQQKFSNWSALNQEISQLVKQWPTMPQPAKDVLQSTANFLAGSFAAAYLGAGTQPDLNSCNNVLVTLAQMQASAQSLLAQLAALVAKDQDVTAFQDFLLKSKPQTDLLASITSALGPLKSADLLQQIRAVVDAENNLNQRMSAASTAASTNDVSNFRPALSVFAFSLPLAQDLAAKIRSEIDRQLPSVSERWRSLLMEALSQIYDRADTGFSQLADWHNKLMWLVGCALLFILALAMTFQNAVLLLLGAVGGLLSRLGRNMKAADVENDYGASWGKLFLSPVTGALSAWAGILLIILGIKLNVLGVALGLDWCNPYDPFALAIALLFGFSERLFDGVVSQIETKFLKAPPATPGTSATTGNPQPKITPTDPLKAPAGKQTALTVRGQNFQSGATATYLDKSGHQLEADVVFKDSTTLTVTIKPLASDTYKSTMTVINPDKQSATADLTITGSA